VAATAASGSLARYTTVLLDLGGVVFVGEDAIPGAIDAVDRLRGAGVTLRFLTNTTRRPLRRLLHDLRDLGLQVGPGEVFTPALAARTLLAERRLTPHLLIHPDLAEDFERAPGVPDAVLVGDAGEAFSYPALNEAFRLLDGGAELIALARNRSFRDRDGRLSLDAGPFVAALEYAARKAATLLGKPSSAFFELAMADTGTAAEHTAMIGDDVEADVSGAMKAGLAGLLVRTGKYKAGDESRIEPSPTQVFEDLRAAVDWLLEPVAGDPTNGSGQRGTAPA
jgi:HAD superfamily hydrolase (TIGR01458 family)